MSRVFLASARWSDFILASLLLFSGSLASAHQASDSYLWVDVDQTAVSGRWDVALVDLEVLTGLDANIDGAITWGEVRSRSAEIRSAMFSSLTMAVGDQACTIDSGPLQVDQHAGSAYVSIGFTAACPGLQAGMIPAVDYRLLFDIDSGHRGFLYVSANGASHTTILSPDSSRWSLVPGDGSAVRSSFVAFVIEGIWHIWIGYDHVAFLVLLLLPSVLRRDRGRWQPEDQLVQVAIDTGKIVTAFTLAHSVTLAAAALGWVQPPMGLVEASIALSVILAGLHNVFPLRLGPRWLLALVFGLVHGFGFANVLGELGGGTRLIAELIGFNIGVELGQLAIAAVVLPVLFFLRHFLLYRRVVMPAASLLTALVATHWLLQRI